MKLKSIELLGFKSFAKKTVIKFDNPIVSIVGPNGSGKSNIAEGISFVLGEQSIKSLRGKSGADLIFKGSKNLSHFNKASVSVVFDNKDKKFTLASADSKKEIKLDYNQITISREVYRDGINRYLINGSEVRLKDILSVLASVNVGSSGHQIISQGEADRILNSSLKDRREMIEDSLGLKVYQYRLKESERKLEKTKNNIKEAQSLRREIAPYINFLKKQVEKVEKTEKMRTELELLYKEYFKKEENYIEKEKNILNQEKKIINQKLEKITKALEETKKEEKNNFIPEQEQLQPTEEKIQKIRILKDELSRKLGRIEGRLEINSKNLVVLPVSMEEIDVFISDLQDYLDQALLGNELQEVFDILERIKVLVDQFNPSLKDEKPTNYKNDELIKTKNDILKELSALEAEEKKFYQLIKEFRTTIDRKRMDEREEEKEQFKLKIEEKDIKSQDNLISIQEDNLYKTEVNFKEEIREAEVLIGPVIFSYKKFKLLIESENESREIQEIRRKKIERIKIRLEDIGSIGSSEVIKEYQEVAERDEFLSKEIEDLNKSVESLKILIKELKEKIDGEFKEGIDKINKQFQKFFELMFGGGKASLSVINASNRKKKQQDEEDIEFKNIPTLIEEEGEIEQGIDINVSLPRKKSKDLHMFSGGERSLTSIALLFAISQVNPPPFLILDETDAALDEANSRKYGDMVENLSKHSQLILITHNRETMSRSHVLYGVTIGIDGASKLLSVNLSQAVQIAK
ncbi:hypothetical protein A2995_00640 [Candidatus Nomurabacteria bacterium RIFCSPLOWO2_01_FULL_33_24]|uniref:RecF/RecN/SMC N-terminal domain-containing protein n=1 Tax=Candidatus Nomurabacteria bacterium RIFCSPLOWO2_01_FULL_33_24 TaxID=1801765 RepID=A0A1F6X0Z6_9BACT|nr:MAG: hypothetical protein A2995_00640 [Candidatus Nomurabacteria bacterium RIFCSPLOWO2_01_FULL_33_24]